MQSEINQAQKDKYCMIHLEEDPKIVKLMEAESRAVAARLWGRGYREVFSAGTTLRLMQDALASAVPQTLRSPITMPSGTLKNLVRGARFLVKMVEQADAVLTSSQDHVNYN